MSRSMQYRLWSLAVRLRFGRPLLWEIHPRHPPRAVSARATNSLFLSAALSSHSLPAGRELGAALVWGKEGILPQLGLLLVPSESALRTTPLLVFISAVVVSLLLLGLVTSTGEEFVQAHGRS